MYEGLGYEAMMAKSGVYRSDNQPVGCLLRQRNVGRMAQCRIDTTTGNRYLWIIKY